MCNTFLLGNGNFKANTKIMKNILIALDYGLSAKEIAQKGYDLAKKMKAKVTLLHAVPTENYYDMMDSRPFISHYGIDMFNMVDAGNLVGSSLKYLEKIKTHLGDHTIEAIAIQGNFTEIILEAAKERKADLIVIGSHSHNWIEKTIMGTVTQEMLDKSTVPLYIVPVKEK